MATLFFEGFDRATVLRKLDSNYWSTQYRNYPQYAFGGYTYANEEFDNYRIVYTYSNVNNGIEPRIVFNGYTRVDGYIGYSFNERYPSLGQMPGFLALTNIPLNDTFNLEPITYLKISGFPDISGSKSYFGMRCLGIETKHQDYWNAVHPLGRFGPKHPLLAFCSGNTTGLILNIVAISGNHLLPLRTDDPPLNEGRRISMGLEVEQHGASSGIFDLNIGDTISDYRITPIYCAGSPYDAFSTPVYIPTNSDYKLLTIATSPRGGSVRSVSSRWTHFEFEIDHENGVIKAKIEGVDALVENTDIDTNREDWNIAINISGFKYDNIRLFNRTYISGIACDGHQGYFPKPWSDIGMLNTAYYYHGAITLYDDITLIDSAGPAPNYYVGYDSKILPLHPGIIGANPYPLNQDSNVADGLLQWDTNVSSHRKALTSLDKDVSNISTSTSGAVNAVVYSNINLSVDIDTNSLWRTTFNDGIGGIKVYNSARKNFLDASYINVVREPNPDAGYNPQIYLQAENNIIKNYLKYPKTVNKFGNTTVSNTITLTSQSIDFTTPDSFIYVETPNIGSLSFTIESWVYLPTTGAMMLFNTTPINDIRGPFTTQAYNAGSSNASAFYSFSVHTSGIDLNMVAPNRYIYRTLLFPTSLVTGTWNHVAITRNSDKNIICYLNGISGTTYAVKEMYTSDGFYPQFNEFREPTGIYNKALKIPASSTPYNDLTVTYEGWLSYGAESYYAAIYPTWYVNIGRNGYIDQYRYVLGTSLYNSNFTPDSTTRIKRPDDYYAEFGPVHESTRSLYILDQFYQMINPTTNQPWSSGDVVTSGLILGVKKL
jgi:hypothetical protein